LPELLSSQASPPAQLLHGFPLCRQVDSADVVLAGIAYQQSVLIYRHVPFLSFSAWFINLG
jgi:hypothetical protein